MSDSNTAKGLVGGQLQVLETITLDKKRPTDPSGRVASSGHPLLGDIFKRGQMVPKDTKLVEPPMWLLRQELLGYNSWRLPKKPELNPPKAIVRKAPTTYLCEECKERVEDVYLVDNGGGKQKWLCADCRDTFERLDRIGVAANGLVLYPAKVIQGNLRHPQYRFMIGERNEKSLMRYCRMCNRVFLSDLEWADHLAKQADAGVLPCTIRLQNAYSILLGRKTCVCCPKTTERATWGIPLCSVGCEQAFKFERMRWSKLEGAIVQEQLNRANAKKK